MIIYLDIVFLVNFLFDFMILFTCDKLLKTKKTKKSLFLGSFFGTITTLLLFFKLKKSVLLIVKFLISIAMVIITFGKENLFRKLYYFYFVSIILGGFSYLIKLTFFESKIKSNNISSSLVIYLILSPIMLYSYLKQTSFFKFKRNLYHQVEIIIGKNIYHYQGYIDTGNSLYDPIKRKPVLLLYDQKFQLDFPTTYVPYKTLSGSGIIPCIKIDKLFLDSKEVSKECLLGIANEKFKISGISTKLILHKDFLE